MFNTKRTQAIFSLILAAGLWLLLIVLGSIFPSGSGMHRFFELLGGSGHGIIQALIYALFFFSMF
jgi:hypothetical protein